MPTKTTMEFINALLANQAESKTGKTDPKFEGKFYAKYTDTAMHYMGWVAVDNSALEAFTEDFPTKAEAIAWLNEF